MKELIRKLVEAWGPSGYEHQVRELIRDEVRSLADEIKVDALGNLICRVGSSGRRVMIAAHMDEIGIMVSHIDRLGYLRFANVGALLENSLFGNRVKFENGIIGTIAVEDSWSSNRKNNPALDKFYIDASTGDDESPIKVGDTAILWRTMDERGSRLISKSMDDRIGCAVAIETMRRLKQSGTPNEIYFAFTVQEEVGLRGATTAGYGINPDVGIAIDVTITGDTPKGAEVEVHLGKGPAIKILDVRHIAAPAVKDWMINTAEASNIPYQREILMLGSTDAAAIQIAQSGVPSGALSIPCRNVHTTSETVDINDIQGSIDLLTAMLANPIANLKPE